MERKEASYSAIADDSVSCSNQALSNSKEATTNIQDNIKSHQQSASAQLHG